MGASLAGAKFWRDVAAAVVAGSLLLAIPWALGWLPKIWHWLVQVAELISAGLLYSVPVSLTAVAALLIAIVLLWHLLAQSEARRTLSAAPANPDPVPPHRFQPTDLQERVLKELAALDGEPVHPTVLQQHLNAGGLLLEQALRDLESRDLIWRHSGGYGGVSGIGLTDAGQDFVIAAGFARDQPHRRY